MATLAANRHPRATHQWLLMGIQVCRLPALLQPTGTPGPHINGFLWPLLQPTGTPGPHIHTSMASYGHPSLPFASSLVANRHPRATHQWLLMGVQVCRLPALKPLKRSKRLKRSKPLQTVEPVKRWLRVLPLAAISYPGHTSMASSGHSCSQPPPQGHTSMASYGHSCSQQAPQGHTSMASYGHPSLPFASSLAANRHPRATHQWLLMGVQVCRLPALKPLKRSKRLERSKPLQTVQPVKRWLRVLPLAAISYPGHTSMVSSGHSCSQPPPQGHTSMASYSHSCSQQAPQGHTSMASYGHPSLPFASSLAANRHPRATHQWLLMATLAANRHPRATHQWLLMGIQVCRLPALL